ncbi:Small ribosomal subunit biogenesis GTPase RsgA [Thauera sp. GDN1]|uniref:ribosome small subunit-dependent GTPase A n=1 Tax=Thauera sp. GDN1 TaxID=2944810 RepID=UPI0024797979|nr:ribosome small subunit-dependent GTPase A [Thauera sp. GDN1]WEN42053.1 Small ribosomal subunit biogenesis GTPase RsgA [Thauera sp. GDN1]
MRKRIHPGNPAAARTPGIIVAAFGRHYEVDTAAGRLQCYPRGKKSNYACGDAVEILRGGDGQGVIETLRPRRNLLWRSDAFREKLIAANLSHIVIVVATEPGFSDLLVSRCIAAAESQDITPLIVLNKADLVDRLPAARAQLEPFRRLGYEVLEVSALQGAEHLRQRLKGLHAIFVGQSGMGKSTLTNALIPEANAATREISDALDSGKHTTTFARLYPLEPNASEDAAEPGNEAAAGWLIDSPGLQVFGLAHLSAEDLAEAFVEFRPHLGRCRFRDCRHDSEPGCALLAAVAAGSIHPRRWEHFRSIRAEIAEARRLNPGW